MRGNRLLRVGAVGMAVALLLAACGDSGDGGGADPGPSEPGQPGTPSEPAPPAQPGDADYEAGGPAIDADTLVIGMINDVTSPNLMRFAAFTPDIVVNRPISGTLTTRGRDGFSHPSIATDWSVSEDGLAWTVNLRDDVYFHNGEKLTAEDVAFSIELVADPDFGSPAHTYWQEVDRAEVVSDTQVVFHLSQPKSLFMHDADRGAIIPKAHYEEVGEEAFTRHPISAGPYKLVEWRPDEHLIVERFDDYWGEPPAIKTIIFRPIPNEPARAAALVAGEIDVVFNLGPDQVDLVNNTPGREVRAVPGLIRSWVFMDSTRPPFDDLRARQAVNYAINVPELVDSLMEGFAQQIPAITVPLEPGHDDTLEPYPYDPDRARELLTEAGYPDGVDVGLTIQDGRLKAAEVGEAIAGYLEAVGIRTDIRLADTTEFAQIFSDKRPTELAVAGWSGGGLFHGSQFYRSQPRCEGGNPTWSGFYCNPELDAAIDRALEAWGNDQDAGAELIKEAEQIYYDDAGSGFLFVTSNIYGVKSRLDWDPHPSMEFFGPEFSWR